MLNIITSVNIPSRGKQVYDEDTLIKVRGMLNDIEQTGLSEIRRLGELFGDLASAQEIIVPKSILKEAFDGLSEADRGAMLRISDRIRKFSVAQKESLYSLSIQIPGGTVGHDIIPVQTAGCYAPGGRFPLPSSVFMTVIPAKVAGVKNVIVASPNPTQHTLAAAYIAEADAFVRVGGVQAIGGMAYGLFGYPAANVIVGPGNRWVTASKQIISGQIGIDMLAGPSELMIVADEYADARTISADLLAQAEHDPEALPVLICTSQTVIDQANSALKKDLESLPAANREIARQSLKNGYAVLVKDIDEAARIANAHAPEHLELLIEDAKTHSSKFTECGGLFIGSSAAEVIGDYGAGPNHTLPTGGTAKHKGGLSVFNFLRVRTWINIDDNIAASGLYTDAGILGRIEGLEGHARSAERRVEPNKSSA
ncbi:MAG: histidinol dehydrogenase [Saprospiraceae bacterium]|nr:histidinol dehydrogenase [Saprospiraceae bacterium]